MLLLPEIVFWIAMAVVLGPYIGYPLSLYVLALFRKRDSAAGGSLLPVTMVISAYNEEGGIREKIENSLALDYPQDLLDVVVVSDASGDATDAIVDSFANRGIRLFRQKTRSGKSAGLTNVMSTIDREIVLFSDANSMYDPQALQHLVRHFADPRIGYVVGHQRYNDGEDGTAGASEQAYWSYEVKLKQFESSIGSVVGGDGAIYAIRRELFRPLRDEDISDFVNPLQIIAQGYRGLFEPQAVCYEDTAQDFRGEFRRKVRIVNRSLRGLMRVPSVLNPFRVGMFAYQIVLHKLLRWFVPFFLVAAFVSNVYLVVDDRPLIYSATLTTQLLAYGTAMLWFIPWFRNVRLVYLAYYFCLANVAALVAVLSCLVGRRFVTWTPDRKNPESLPATSPQR